MSNKKQFSHSVSIVGWGALLVWWGVAIAIDPITLGMCAIGTGLIMLSLNAARLLNGVRTVRSTTIFGIIALAWGALDQARSMLGLPDGVSFALMLVVTGLVVWMTLLFPQAREEPA
jgi:hypothetical protein